MRKLAKYSLALQVAIAGVALAQMQSNPAVQDRTGAGAGTPAAQPGTIDDRSGTVKEHNGQVMPAGTVRASKLIGTTVYNQQGTRLGEVKDAVLDKGLKKVGYVVLSYGGIAGMGNKLFAVPRDMVELSPTGESRAMVSLDEQTLRNAPGFDKNDWPTEANADYYRNLDQYYRQHGGDRLSQSMKGDHAQPAAAQVSGEGRLTWDRRASELIGARVRSPQGENLGEVNDLVLDWPGGDIRYAVLSYGGLLGFGDKLFAVPMDQFEARDHTLVLGVDKQQLKDAPGFDKNQWPDMANPQWSKAVDEYYQQHGVKSQGNTGRDDLTR